MILVKKQHLAHTVSPDAHLCEWPLQEKQRTCISPIDSHSEVTLTGHFWQQSNKSIFFRFCNIISFKDLFLEEFFDSNRIDTDQKCRQSQITPGTLWLHRMHPNHPVAGSQRVMSFAFEQWILFKKIIIMLLLLLLDKCQYRAGKHKSLNIDRNNILVSHNQMNMTDI